MHLFWLACEKAFQAAIWIFAGPAIAFMVLANLPMSAADWCSEMKRKAKTKSPRPGANPRARAL